MSRLTKEEIKQCYQFHSQIREGGKTLLLKVCNELLEYKNIEEKLGIDLITLFKALDNGIYVKNKSTKIKLSIGRHLISKLLEASY